MNLMLFTVLSLIETGFLPIFIDNNDIFGRVKVINAVQLALATRNTTKKRAIISSVVQPLGE